MTEAGLFETLVEKLKEKHPNIEQMLERGRAKGKEVQVIRDQGKAARRAGDLVDARRLNEMARDLECRHKSDISLTVPSWEHRGEEASCPRCRDMHWLDRGGEYVPCTSCSAFDMEAVRLRHSGIPEARRQQTLGSFKPGVHLLAAEALKDAWNFVNSGKPWLVLSGNPGCGKSHLARGAALELIHQGWDVIYTASVSLATLLHSTQAPGSKRQLDDVMKELAEVDLLVLDDYGAEKQSYFTTPQFEEIFRARNDSLGATIITTNLPRDQIKAISSRIHSRMEDRELSVWRHMAGVPDYRIG